MPDELELSLVLQVFIQCILLLGEFSPLPVKLYVELFELFLMLRVELIDFLVEGFDLVFLLLDDVQVLRSLFVL